MRKNILLNLRTFFVIVYYCTKRELIKSCNRRWARSLVFNILYTRDKIVKPECLNERRFWRFCPFQNLLRPIHPQESVQFSLTNQLELSCVPQIVVGSSFLKLLNNLLTKFIIIELCWGLGYYKGKYVFERTSTPPSH